jgi:hypothetical protein
MESLVDKGQSFGALTFNLATMYELCTESPRQLKLDLAQKVVGIPASDRVGLEKTNADFKL